MSVIDILTRVDAICKKYDKYDVEKQRDLNVSGDDAFARLFTDVENDIEAALQVRVYNCYYRYWGICCAPHIPIFPSCSYLLYLTLVTFSAR